MSIMTHLKNIAKFYTEDYEDYRKTREYMAYLSSLCNSIGLTNRQKHILVREIYATDAKLTRLEKKLDISN